jgi:hypothetical protein
MREKDYYKMQQMYGGLGVCCTPSLNKAGSVYLLPKIITISGVVVDQFGEPIPANIVVEGTANGVQADIDGKFTLNNVPENAMIDFSFAGALTKVPATSVKGTVIITTGFVNEEVVITADKPFNWKTAGYVALGLLFLYAITKPNDTKTVKASI